VSGGIAGDLNTPHVKQLGWLEFALMMRLNTQLAAN